MFFSEEKNQKTFIPGGGGKMRLWPGSWEVRRNKSLLLLFFRKEDSSFPLNFPGRPELPHAAYQQ
jgi:hypothetical protein